MKIYYLQKQIPYHTFSSASQKNTTVGFNMGGKGGNIGSPLLVSLQMKYKTINRYNNINKIKKKKKYKTINKYNINKIKNNIIIIKKIIKKKRTYTSHTNSHWEEDRKVHFSLCNRDTKEPSKNKRFMIDKKKKKKPY
jgi:hypothetical protein